MIPLLLVFLRSCQINKWLLVGVPLSVLLYAFLEHLWVSQDMAKRVKNTSMTLKDFYDKAPGQAPFENRLPSKPGMTKNGYASSRDKNCAVCW